MKQNRKRNRIMEKFTLVTGGAGFAGRHLVDALRREGRTVRSFDIADPLCEDDVRGCVTDPQAVAGAMCGAGTVFHLAGYTGLWAGDVRIFDRVNVQGTQVVVDAARKAGVGRFIHCSSLTTLVGRNMSAARQSVDETANPGPDMMIGAYSRSKCRAEQIVQTAAGAGLDAVTALPTEPLGAGDESLTPPTKMILGFSRGTTPAYMDCILNFVPVKSLARGLIALRDRGRTGERYILGGENIPMRVLLDMIAVQSGKKAPVIRLPYFFALVAGFVDTHVVSAITGAPPRAPLAGVRLAGRRISFSSRKALRETGWKADPAAPALKETVDWFRQKGLLDDRQPESRP